MGSGWSPSSALPTTRPFAASKLVMKLQGLVASVCQKQGRKFGYPAIFEEYLLQGNIISKDTVNSKVVMVL